MEVIQDLKSENNSRLFGFRSKHQKHRRERFDLKTMQGNERKREERDVFVQNVLDHEFERLEELDVK